MDVFIVTDELKKIYTDGLPPQVFKESDLFFGVQEGEYPAGIAAVRAMGDEFLLTYLFVREEFRRQGAGTMLLDSVKETLREIGADRLEVTYTLNDSTAELHDFLEEQELLEDRDEDEKPVLVMQLKDIPEKYRNRKKAEGIVRLKDVRSGQWSLYMADYEKFKKEYPEYAVELKSRDYYDPEFSFVRMNKKKQIEAALLFSRHGNDLVLEHAIRITKPTRSDFMTLAFAAITEAAAADPDMSISYCVYNPKILPVSDAISGRKAKKIGVSVTHFYEF